MKIFYWSPFLSNIATIDAVLNSIKLYYSILVSVTGKQITAGQSGGQSPATITIGQHI